MIKFVRLLAELPVGLPEALPVPADLLLYTACEWEALHARGGRFARVLAAETVWLGGRRG